MKLSVIVPTRNRVADLRAFVPTLVAQSVTPDELIVVDSGDVPGIREVLRELLAGSGISLVYAHSDPSTSLQRNIGIDLSSGDILFFFDDDIELEPDYIERTLECFKLHRTPPVGGVMGTQTNAPYAGLAREIIYGAFELTHWTRSDKAKLYKSGGVRYCVKPSQVVDVPVCYGCCMAFKKECFDTERFAEFLPGYTLNEDVELSYRISRKWTLLQTPFARVLHKVSSVSRESIPDTVSRLIFAKYWFVRRHRPHDAPHMAAFAWANLGLASLYVARGISRKEPGLPAILRGMKQGYRRCLEDWASD